jgi:hypothetical protein
MIENAFEVAKRADQDKGLEIVIEAGCGASLRLPMIGPEAHRRVPAKLVAVGGGVTRGNWVRVPVKRRGRPPKSESVITQAAAAPARERKGMSAAKRKEQSERMKAFWAKPARAAGDNDVHRSVHEKMLLASNVRPTSAF